MQPTLKQLAEAMNLTADELAVFLNENPSAAKAEMEREEKEPPVNPRLAHHVVTAPKPGPTIVRDMAAYHAAKAQGFYLTAADPTNPRHIEATQLMLAEYQLALIWHELLHVAQGVNAEGLAQAIVEDLAAPERLPESIHDLCADADVNPNDIAPYMAS